MLKGAGEISSKLAICVTEGLGGVGVGACDGILAILLGDGPFSFLLLFGVFLIVAAVGIIAGAVHVRLHGAGPDEKRVKGLRGSVLLGSAAAHTARGESTCCRDRFGASLAPRHSVYALRRAFRSQNDPFRTFADVGS